MSWNKSARAVPVAGLLLPVAAFAQDLVVGMLGSLKIRWWQAAPRSSN